MVASTLMPSPPPKLAVAGASHEPMLNSNGGFQAITGATSTCMTMGSSFRISERRGCIDSLASDGLDPSSGLGQAAAADGSAEKQQPSKAVLQLSAAELRKELMERQTLMFKVDSSAPAASGRRAVLPFATKEAVQLGWEVMRARCKADGRQLSTSFGNFDQRVGLGWLLGDMVCGCFIPFDDALAVGTKAVKAGPDLKAEFAAPRRRAEKARYACTEERERALEAAATEEVELRRTNAELPMPAAMPPEMAVKVKRRRVEAVMPPPAPVLRTKLQDLKAAVATAETAFALTEGAFAAALRSADAARSAYETALKKERDSFRTGDPKSLSWLTRTAALRLAARARLSQGSVCA